MHTKFIMPISRRASINKKNNTKNDNSLIDELFNATFPWQILKTLVNNDHVDDQCHYQEQTFVPKLDVLSDDKEYTIKVEIPGISIDNIKLDLKDKTLILSGEKEKINTENSEIKHHMAERTFGKFYREINLPDDSDLETIKINKL